MSLFLGLLAPVLNLALCDVRSSLPEKTQAGTKNAAWHPQIPSNAPRTKGLAEVWLVLGENPPRSRGVCLRAAVTARLAGGTGGTRRADRSNAPRWGGRAAGQSLERGQMSGRHGSICNSTSGAYLARKKNLHRIRLVNWEQTFPDSAAGAAWEQKWL